MLAECEALVQSIAKVCDAILWLPSTPSTSTAMTQDDEPLTTSIIQTIHASLGPNHMTALQA
jgi:hypothetical protein